MDDLTDATPEPTENLEETVHTPVEGGDVSSPDDPFDSGADSFDRAYVERLRKESAQYRTKAKDYETYAKAFEPYGDEDRQVWQEAMRLFNEDPAQGADYLERIAQAVKAGFTQEQAEAIADSTDTDEPLTRADLDRIFAEKEAAAEKEREIARIESEAKDLGYDPKSDEYTYLLTVASRLPSGSLQEAHKKIEASYQARIDAAFAKKAKEADESPAVPADAGYAPSSERPLRTWKDADAAFRARLEAARSRGQ